MKAPKVTNAGADATWFAHWKPIAQKVANQLGLDINIIDARDWRCEVRVISPTHLELFMLTISHPSYAKGTSHIGGMGYLLSGIDTDVWFKGPAS